MSTKAVGGGAVLLLLGKTIPPSFRKHMQHWSVAAAADVSKIRETLKWFLLVAAKHLPVCVCGTASLIWRQERVVEGPTCLRIPSF